MALDRQTKIWLLLGIDTTFFFIELISGIAVSSLALLADSFHMLNDVVSLVVALQAIKLAESESTAKYTYGWQRAEVLGALVNGVFLVALCFSIALEAISRFFTGVDISNPMIMVVVGSFGLISNLLGLLLFHDHAGHSHGHSHEHSHSHDDATTSHSPHSAPSPPLPASERTPLLKPTSVTIPVEEETEYRNDEELAEEELYVHPGTLRDSIVRAGLHRHAGPAPHGHDDDSPGEAEGSMNMKGVFLHVLGDAIGNIGVVGTGLFIAYTSYSWRMYSDPVVSLVISVIIFSSALPLCKSASYILLQATPSSVPLEQMRIAIAATPGVLNVHELHVWSLSETKSIASVHIITKEDDFIDVSGKIRVLMHGFGVHSSTIQPEIVHNTAPDVESCPNPCVTDDCRDSSCCPTPK